MVTMELDPAKLPALRAAMRLRRTRQREGWARTAEWLGIPVPADGFKSDSELGERIIADPEAVRLCRAYCKEVHARVRAGATEQAAIAEVNALESLPDPYPWRPAPAGTLKPPPHDATPEKR